MDSCSQKIQSVNDEVLEKFGPKTVKRADIKFKKGYSFPCKQCDYAFKSMSALNNPKNLEHGLSFNSSKRPQEPLHSTRNNSLTSCLMLEDVSIPTSDIDSITLSEITCEKKEEPSIICDWDPCSFKSKDRNMLINHIDDHIGKYYCR